MSSRELRASLPCPIFGLRLFGMFIILPVFALWATGRPGWDLQTAGIALGAYGLSQALLQIPFGILSDRLGRKPLMYLGLAILAAGSFVCAVAESPALMILGRVIQGAGAISSVAIAAAADLTSEAQRTKAMAIIGSTIGAVFGISFVAAPFLMVKIGVAGIFALPERWRCRDGGGALGGAGRDSAAARPAHPGLREVGATGAAPAQVGILCCTRC